VFAVGFRTGGRIARAGDSGNLSVGYIELDRFTWMALSFAEPTVRYDDRSVFACPGRRIKSAQSVECL
jgi:hypothetical protein